VKTKGGRKNERVVFEVLGGSRLWRARDGRCDSLQASMAMPSGVRALLRDRIIHHQLRMSKGYCPIYARDSICDMFEQYKALKGNHGVSDLIEKLLALPTEKPKRERTKSIEA
jgi:hypothetical protein